MITMLSLTTVPSQIEQSSVSVYRMERNSEQLSVLFTWAGLNLEQAGGVLLRYVVTLTPTGGMVGSNLYVWTSYVQVVFRL